MLKILGTVAICALPFAILIALIFLIKDEEKG